MQTQSAMTLLPRSERKWWRDAVTYQIYIRSFADANGDGKEMSKVFARGCRI